MKKLASKPSLPRKTSDLFSDLKDFDESERTAVMESRTIRYRNRHNRMTKALKLHLPNATLVQGDDPECRFDVLVVNYDRNGRDLLIEAKPDHDKGSIRLAVGQLLDYRRSLPNRLATDLAVLTITRPAEDYSAFLDDLQISQIWFEGEACSSLSCSGKISLTLLALIVGN